ncbi:hypothetical protein KC340_g3209 [Hortaea werneckii]|nr:hypothetical protein KC342_g13653 [Hortaea werneckii]KAI7099036.1 hypothetical protein KC339_g8519 [Hortaea werneckii]KAI7209863.1 hypothetical protein KC365_g15510 [Hortaea werneckii]KAI7332839.1 hypothetical protein KC340_g3209 [Hortaea werneckii]KAI7373848.1 hypothetical protein KC328_g16370 [Hortaea werneckii]
MAVAHIVLIYGTNNVQIEGNSFTEIDIRHRRIGAGLVLAARILYAAFIWLSKLTVSEFLKRITIRIWRPSYETVLHGIRIFLAMTFIAVIIATLAECQPFEDYYQLIPDPGPQCRQGYAQLLTMGTCDVITDILLVAFPIPIVLRSGQTWKRKLQLGSLFSLSVIMIALTVTRMKEVIEHRGRQQYRTVWASCEILASTVVSNAVILGSFLRDKGTKRNKWKSPSVSDSIDRASVRRPTVTALQEMGSDEDLFRFLGCRIPEHLREQPETVPRPAPAALPASATEKRGGGAAHLRLSDEIRLSTQSGETHRRSRELSPTGSQRTVPSSPSPPRNRSMSFFDVGGLLETASSGSRPGTRSRETTFSESECSGGTMVQDFAPPRRLQSTTRGSQAFLADIGGILQADEEMGCEARKYAGGGGGLSQPGHAPTGILGPMLERRETQQSLQDAGGLLLGRIASKEASTSSSPGNDESFSISWPGERAGQSQKWPLSLSGRHEQETAAGHTGADVRRGFATSTTTTTHTNSQRSPRNTMETTGPLAASQVRGGYRDPDDMTIYDPGGLLTR